jgi:signal transduction histidine kinase
VGLDRFRKLPPIVGDAAIVAVLIAAGLLQQLAVPHPEHEDPVDPRALVHAAVIVAAILPLLMHRRFPLLTVVVMSAVIGVAGSIGPFLAYDPSPASFFGLMFAVFNAAALGGRVHGWAALLLACVAATLVLRPWFSPPGAWIPGYPYFIVAYVAGRVQRERLALARLLGERVVDEEVNRERLQQLSLAEVRAGLARDLHDVVVTSVRRMLDQARAAYARLALASCDPSPELRMAEETGRTALAEMRLLLDVLRPEEQAGSRTVPPREDVPPDAVGRGRIAAALRPLLSRGWAVDLLLVSVLATAAMLEFRIWEETLGPGLRPAVFSDAAHAWALAWILLLVLRRPAPVLVGVAMAVMAFLQTYPLGYWTPVADIAALQVAVYTIGSLRPGRPHAWVVAVLGSIGIVSIPPPPVTLGVVGFLVIVVVTLGGAAYVGTVVGERRRLNAELDLRLALLGEERRNELALRLRQERTALARDLHDLVAHSVTLMVVQAGAARTVSAIDRDGARRAVQAVLDAGGQAEDELAQLLALLTDDGQPAPPPGPRDLSDLVTSARSTGQQVELELVGQDALPAGSSVALSTYRIVQEALTNARKHAPGSSVQVQLRCEPHRVSVRIENGPAGRSDGPSELEGLGAGRGLTGIRERVAVFGGRLESGSLPGGGYVVEALMPLEAP